MSYGVFRNNDEFLQKVFLPSNVFFIHKLYRLDYYIPSYKASSSRIFSNKFSTRKELFIQSTMQGSGREGGLKWRHFKSSSLFIILCFC